MTNPLVFKMARNKLWHYASGKFHLLGALCDTCKDMYAFPGKVESLFLLKCVNATRRKELSVTNYASELILRLGFTCLCRIVSGTNEL